MGNTRLVTRPLMVATILGLIVALAVLSGCGGGDGIGFGACKGWIYTDGTRSIISGSSTAPSGYLPVSGATVQLAPPAAQTSTAQTLLQPQTQTDTDGYYFLSPIPAGLQTLMVSGAPGGTFYLQLMIIAGRVTVGGGHSQGGS